MKAYLFLKANMYIKIKYEFIFEAQIKKKVKRYFMQFWKNI